MAQARNVVILEKGCLDPGFHKRDPDENLPATCGENVVDLEAEGNDYEVVWRDKKEKQAFVTRCCPLKFLYIKS